MKYAMSKSTLKNRPYTKLPIDISTIDSRKIVFKKPNPDDLSRIFSNLYNYLNDRYECTNFSSTICYRASDSSVDKVISDVCMIDGITEDMIDKYIIVEESLDNPKDVLIFVSYQ